MRFFKIYFIIIYSRTNTHTYVTGSMVKYYSRKIFTSNRILKPKPKKKIVNCSSLFLTLREFFTATLAHSQFTGSYFCRARYTQLSNLKYRWFRSRRNPPEQLVSLGLYKTCTSAVILLSPGSFLFFLHSVRQLYLQSETSDRPV